MSKSSSRIVEIDRKLYKVNNTSYRKVVGGTNVLEPTTASSVEPTIICGTYKFSPTD